MGGYFGEGNEWHLMCANKKAVQVISSENGIWIENKFKSVSKKSNEANNNKWISMRKSFISLAITEKSIFGVTENGKIYQCAKECKSPKEWKKFVSPTLTPINKNDQSIGSKMREKLKMNPLFHGKLTQLTAFNDLFFGLDEIGNLWKYISETEEWIKIETMFSLKWIQATNSNILYVINEEDNKVYTVNLETKQYELIHDANDFEQVIFDADDGKIWALNYYKQLFYLNDKGNDWIYVTDEIHFISLGKIPLDVDNAKSDL